VNEALEHYGEAVGYKGNMTDMSSMSSAPSANAKVVDLANYQSSQAFAEKAQELYQQIKSKALPGTDNAVKALDDSFPALVNAIKGKASPMEIMQIAHTKIHPSLMTAYSLLAT
jgi:hypothetical protein